VVHRLNLVPQHAKYGVGDRKMKIFDDLHVVGGTTTQRSQSDFICPPWKPVMPGGNRPGLAGKLRSGEYVGGVAAGADGEGDVAGCEQIFELSTKTAIIAVSFAKP